MPGPETASEIIASACGLPPDGPAPQRCFMCGGVAYRQDCSVSEALSDRFTDFAPMRMKWQPQVCTACRWAMENRRVFLPGRQGVAIMFRPGEARTLTTAGLAGLVFEETKTPFVLIRGDGKKHVFHRAVPTVDPDLMLVQWGLETVVIDRPALAAAVRAYIEGNRFRRDPAWLADGGTGLTLWGALLAGARELLACADGKQSADKKNKKQRKTRRH